MEVLIIVWQYFLYFCHVGHFVDLTQLSPFIIILWFPFFFAYNLGSRVCLCMLLFFLLWTCKRAVSSWCKVSFIINCFLCWSKVMWFVKTEQGGHKLQSEALGNLNILNYCFIDVEKVKSMHELWERNQII